MSYTIVEVMLDHGGYKCGYCQQSDTSLSQGMWAHKMNAIDYQDLIDRGWRRSGKYCYKPEMDKTCCPQYTIRCKCLDFNLSKSQRKVLNKVKNFLRGGDEKEEVKKWKQKYETRKSDALKPAEEKPKSETMTNGNITEHDICHNRSARSSPNLETQNSAKKKIEPGVGADPNKPLQKKAKEIRKERRKLKSSNQENLPSPLKHRPTVAKTIEDFIPHLITETEMKNKLTVRLVHASTDDPEFIATRKESHRVYTRYQMTIHGDSEDDCKESQWLRFLVHSPLTGEGRNPTLGSFHQQYVLNGRIIAVGVVDILPYCLSSVYLYYDPDYGFLSPGVYSALSEVAYARHLHKLRNNIEYYYMGFYIQSCPKMRYKNSYVPSELLCPVNYTWVSMEKCIKALDRSKYCVLSKIDTNDPDNDTPSDNSTESLSLTNIGILYDRTLYRYPRYAVTKYSNTILGQAEIRDAISKEEKLLTTYLKLVGQTCANRMFIYRPPLELDDDDGDSS